MKLEATLTAIGAVITLGFVLTRAPYLMGATVFVALPLFAVASSYYLRRVYLDLRAGTRL